MNSFTTLDGYFQYDLISLVITLFIPGTDRTPFIIPSFKSNSKV